MLYRILTEDKDREGIEKIVASFYSGFTILEATGYWNGKKEKSVAVEIGTVTNENRKIRKLAREIKQLNSQECVLIQIIGDKAIFV